MEPATVGQNYSPDSIKTVANGESIEAQIPREAIESVAEAYGLSYDEALREILRTGIDEKLAVIEMLESESEVSEREDGAHTVHPYHGQTDDDGGEA